MDLRPYQVELKNKIFSQWAKGTQNVGIQMPTGSGKTLLFSNIAAEHTGYCLIIAHRIEIVTQISLTLAKLKIQTNLIIPPKSVEQIIKIQMGEIGHSFFDPNAKHIVASIDSFLKLKKNPPAWLKKITLLIQDEAHHVLKKNKWGEVAEMFPHAKGLYPTATPRRADGIGLGRDSGGVIDMLLLGPPMKYLIDEGYLSRYRIIDPGCKIPLQTIKLSITGDFNSKSLSKTVHESKITGDIVATYLKFAPGKMGVTFAVDIAAANEISNAFNTAGVPSVVITSNTSPEVRAYIMHQFRNREILQIVNVDILGEGVDVPAIEVVIFARPTQSYALYCQQFGRALRPSPGKEHAIIIDHCGNVMQHLLPDNVKLLWSLDGCKKTSNTSNLIPIKNCLNPECLNVYERIFKSCPFCGHTEEITNRKCIKAVDGDLTEVSPEVLRLLRGEILRMETPPVFPHNATSIVRGAILKKHNARCEAHSELRKIILKYVDDQLKLGKSKSEIYRLFFFTFGIDILSAQVLNRKDSLNLKKLIVDLK